MEVLRVNNKLPKIILPKEKTELFMNWYKQDLYNEDSVPEVFNEGYFYVDLSNFIKITKFNVFELNGNRFKLQEQLINSIHERYDSTIIYFKFIKANTLKLIYYSQKTGEILGKIEEFDYETMLKTRRSIQNMRNIILKNDFKVSNIDVDLVFDIPSLAKEALQEIEKGNVVDFDNILNGFNFDWSNICFYLLMSALWYLVSIKNEKENTDLIMASYSKTKTTHCKKNNKRRSQNYVKNITTPIFDLAKTKSLSVNKLIAKKRGWKISCEFSVRGHYRHYKSGKVVFVKSFEKGKGLKMKQNIIKLNPSDNKRGLYNE